MTLINAGGIGTQSTLFTAINQRHDYVVYVVFKFHIGCMQMFLYITDRRTSDVYCDTSRFFASINHVGKTHFALY